MKLALGLLLSIVSSFLKIVNSDDTEQLHPTSLEKHEGIFKVDSSNRSTMHFSTMNSPNYLQIDLSKCKNCGLLGSESGYPIMKYGDVVNPTNKYPWMIQFLASYSGQHFICGGAILDEFYILTAAHCLMKNVHGDVKKVEFLGTEDISVSFLTDQYSVKPGPKVQETFIHPEFDFFAKKHDIALLKLKEKIVCDRYKNPVCLPTSDFKIPKDAVFTTAGWGDTELGPFSYELREGSLEFLSFEKCRQEAYLKETVYCFQAPKAKFQMPCHGDSGGPIFMEVNKKYYIVGVLSRVVGGYCEPNTPLVATAVPAYVEWINKIKEFGGNRDELRGKKQKKRRSYTRRNRRKLNGRKRRQQRIGINKK